MNSIVADIVARIVMAIALTLALYLLLRSQSTVGGGFLAAMVFSLGAVFRRMTRPEAVKLPAGVSASTTTSVGLLIMLATGFGGYLWGDKFLSSGTAHVDLALLGPVALHSSWLFEVGMAITAAGVAGALAQEMGDPP